MTIGHDPALCELPVCQRCDDCNYGYAAGKDKMAFEIQTVLENLDQHEHEPCGVPCRLVWEARSAERADFKRRIDERLR